FDARRARRFLGGARGQGGTERAGVARALPRFGRAQGRVGVQVRPRARRARTLAKGPVHVLALVLQTATGGEGRGLFSTLSSQDPTTLVDNLFDLSVGLVLSTLLILALVQTYRATHRGAVYSASFL